MSTDTKAIAKVKTLDEIRSDLARLITADDPGFVLREADKEVSGKEAGKLDLSTPESALFKSMTLFEFDNGTLLTMSVPEQFKTFGINLMKSVQKEYGCQTPSEKATAELVAVNFIRTLEIQRRINNYLGIGTISEIGVKYLAVLSKELDKANRHYLEAIQALRSLKQPNMGINIKAQTAIVGQNQMVQTNNLPNDL